jgi:hypothetical protein
MTGVVEAPSGRSLVRLMTAGISPDTETVVEYG